VVPAGQILEIDGNALTQMTHDWGHDFADNPTVPLHWCLSHINKESE
jgi:hypothetical protein